jgi:hypothetical protein
MLSGVKPDGGRLDGSNPTMGARECRGRRISPDISRRSIRIWTIWNHSFVEMRDKYTTANRKTSPITSGPAQTISYVAQIDLVGHRTNGCGCRTRTKTQSIRYYASVDCKTHPGADINIPGGFVELLQQNVVIRPTGEYTSAGEIGQTVMGVSSDGYRFICDLVEITRGYEDLAGVMNFRTVKVKGSFSSRTRQSNRSTRRQKCRRTTSQTGCAITISIRQVMAHTSRNLTVT